MLIPSVALVLGLTLILLLLLSAVFVTRRRSERSRFPSIVDPADGPASSTLSPGRKLGRKAPLRDARPMERPAKPAAAALDASPLGQRKSAPDTPRSASEAPRPALQIGYTLLLNAACAPADTLKGDPGAAESLARIGAAHRQTATGLGASGKVFPKQACLEIFFALRTRLSAHGAPALQLSWRHLHWRVDDVYELNLTHVGSGRDLALINCFEASTGGESYIEVAEAGAPERRFKLSGAKAAADMIAEGLDKAVEAV
jgi:hypothetical protein